MFPVLLSGVAFKTDILGWTFLILAALLLQLIIYLTYQLTRRKISERNSRRSNEKNALTSLGLLRQTHPHFPIHDANLREYAARSGRDLAYFGTSEEELSALWLKYHEKVVYHFLDALRREPSDSANLFEKILRKHAADSGHDLAYFGTSEEELTELVEKSQHLLFYHPS